MKLENKICPFCNRWLSSFSGELWWCLNDSNDQCNIIHYNSSRKIWVFNRIEYNKDELERLFCTLTVDICA